jgi:RND family efflux transporter MFP subunit
MSGRLKPAAPAVLAAALLAAACSSPADRQTPPPQTASVAVTTGLVDARDWPSFTEAGGTLRARLTASVSSRILAPIVAVRVRPGDRVRRGQVLVELDAAESRAQATRAGASLEAARLSADAAAADVTGADAALELARLTHQRMRTLHEQRSATTQELDAAVAALAAAESRAAAARAAAASAAATFEAAKSGATAGEIVAGYGALAAPFDGVVVERYADPGSMAAPGVPLVVIEDPQALRLEVTADATRAAGLAIGAPADVRLDADGAGAGWTEGRIAEIARVDPASQSFTVKIDVPAGPEWRSGIFGRARFRGPSRQALTAPAAAVIRRGQLALVFVVASDNVARLRSVRIGDAADGRVEVLAGLSAGEVVVIDPPPALKDGGPVTVTPRAAGASDAGGAGR